MELLAQMDGFDQSTNARVIMATNRADMLDPALLWRGRIDCKVEFPLPDRQQKRLVFQACTAGMSLDDERPPPGSRDCASWGQRAAKD